MSIAPPTLRVRSQSEPKFDDEYYYNVIVDALSVIGPETVKNAEEIFARAMETGAWPEQKHQRLSVSCATWIHSVTDYKTEASRKIQDAKDRIASAATSSNFLSFEFKKEDIIQPTKIVSWVIKINKN